VIASAEKKSLDEPGNASFFLSGKLTAKKKRFLAQKQMDALCAHAHKLTIVGLCVKSHRGHEMLKEKLKPCLHTGEWSE
jgi:hypothetical protein